MLNTHFRNKTAVALIDECCILMMIIPVIRGEQNFKKIGTKPTLCKMFVTIDLVLIDTYYTTSPIMLSLNILNGHVLKELWMFWNVTI